MISIASILFLWLLVSIVAGIAIGKFIQFGSAVIPRSRIPSHSIPRWPLLLRKPRPAFLRALFNLGGTP
jgi:hypothetical protein